MTVTLSEPIDEQYRWFSQAACRGLSSDIFYVETGKPTDEAQAICERCPVQEQCLDYALEHNEQHGVWGGFTPRELRLLRRDRRCVTGDRSWRAV